MSDPFSCHHRQNSLRKKLSQIGIHFSFSFSTKNHPKLGRETEREKVSTPYPLLFRGSWSHFTVYQDNAEKKISLSVWEYFAGGVISQLKNETKKISWRPSFPDTAKIPALTWSRRGRECSLFLQHTEMQGVFVFCYQQRVVMSLLSMR